MYSEQVVAEALALAAEGYSAERVSRAMGGTPPAKTIEHWVRMGPPGRRRRRGRVYSSADRLDAVRRVAAGESLAQVAADIGCTAQAVANWRRKLAEGDPMAFMKDPRLPEDAGSREIDELDDDPALLKELLKRTAMERDIAVEVAKLLGKGRAAEAAALPNDDKARLVMALAGRWTVAALLAAVALASSTYYDLRAAIVSGRAGGDRWGAWRAQVADCFHAHRARWGYRRIRCETGIPEHAVRSIMREDGLRVVYGGRRMRRASSYDGARDTSRAPNLPLGPDGVHDFAPGAPNRLWLSDVTEFRLPDEERRVYLSPVYDCHGGFIVAWKVAWSMGSAELTDPSLAAALATLPRGARVVVHTDRGAQYHAASWRSLLAGAGAVQSMSRKATSGDNAPMEGFFGLLKNEFFHHEDWRGVRAEEFGARLDAWIRHYNNERRQIGLGWKTPAQYRAEALGMNKTSTNTTKVA